MVVPTAAVQSGQQGAYVFVVTAEKTAELRPVTVAFEADGEAVVASGLERRRDGRGRGPAAAGARDEGGGEDVDSASNARRRRARGPERSEHLRAVHPPAGDDHAAHRRRRPGRRARLHRRSPVSDLPNVDFPTIQVTASLPGANPETMAVGRRHAAGKGVHHHPRAGQL